MRTLAVGDVDAAHAGDRAAEAEAVVERAIGDDADVHRQPVGGAEALAGPRRRSGVAEPQRVDALAQRAGGAGGVGVGRAAAHPVADAVLGGGVLHPRVAAAGAQRRARRLRAAHCTAGRPVGGVVEAGGVVAAAATAVAAVVLRLQRGTAGGLLR